jgi:hypothetical protein
VLSGAWTFQANCKKKGKTLNEMDLWLLWVTGGFGIASSFWAIGAGYQLMKRILNMSGDD